MSHRCIACDWSPTAPSAYNEALEYYGTKPNRLLHDQHTGETYCNSCYDAIRLTIKIDNVIDEMGE